MPSTKDDAGGGGGSTAVCNTAQCSAVSTQNGTTYSTPVNTAAKIKARVYVVAGGGGGGGESWLIQSGGAGGSGTVGGIGTAVGAWGSVNKGKPGTAGVFGAAGAGAIGTTFQTCTASCAKGHPTPFGADGGAGGGGFNDAKGGTPGWSGGGGGSGESFINKTSALGYVATSSSFAWTGHSAFTNGGAVVITWLNKTKAQIGNPEAPSDCGKDGQQSVAIPPGSTVTLTLAGGNGGEGNDNDIFTFGGKTDSPGGKGATVSATYKNTSTSAQDVTAIQGCDGLLGEEDGGQPGGEGLGNGGSDCQPATCGSSTGAAGSGGGASAICVGTVSPTTANITNNNCTFSTAAKAQQHLLLVAGGGGGGAQHSTCPIFGSGAAGGNGGNDQAGNWVPSTGATQSTAIFGVQVGKTGTAATGTWGKTAVETGKGGPAKLATFAPTGTDGTKGTIDGGGGGGGYTNGNGGVAAPTIISTCFGGTKPSGGGGGSSYAVKQAGTMVIQRCGKYTATKNPHTCPSLGAKNTGTGDPYELKWGSNTKATANGTIGIEEDYAYQAAALVYVSPTTKASTNW